MDGEVKAGVLTISDKGSRNLREDESGKIVKELAKNIPGDVLVYEIIPDEPEMIKERLIPEYFSSYQILF